MEEHVRDERRGRAANDESGQVLILAALSMVMLLVMVALVVDIGKAYLVQRQLQAGVDAAALAGAQHLPDPTEATQVANEYGPSTGAKNAVDVGSAVTTTVTMRCVVSAPGCSSTLNAYNALNVKATSNVRTVFARILGIDKLTVRASATACSPCSAKPLDIMLVLDRTGSMCQFGPGQNDPACTDLGNAKEGMRTFLQFMDPNLDKVGLAVFPPARNQSERDNCVTPSSGSAYYGYDSWWPYWGPWPDTDGDGDPDPPGNPSYYVHASLDFDYLAQGGQGQGWVPNGNSRLFQLIGLPGSGAFGGCIRGVGTTHYASAIEEAQYELNRNGRGDIQDVIIFLSDGAANTSPIRLPNGHWRNSPYWTSHPCAAGVEAASRAKADGDVIYTIGYDLDAGSAAPEKCRQPNANGHMNGSNPVESGYDAESAIKAMASEPDNFYKKPDPGKLNIIFTRIAADLARPAARLIDDNTP